MKKLLCLLLSVLSVLFLAACDSEVEEFDETYDYTQITQITHPAEESYVDAIRLMMKTFSNDFTKEELERMYPPAMWTYFEEKYGKTLDDIYEDFSGRMAKTWEKSQQEVGEGAEVKYELLSMIEYEGPTYESFKEQMGRDYGIAYDSFGRCYEVRTKKAVVGKLKEKIDTKFYHVIEIDGTWYVSEVLTEMLGL